MEVGRVGHVTQEGRRGEEAGTETVGGEGVRQEHPAIGIEEQQGWSPGQACPENRARGAPRVGRAKARKRAESVVHRAWPVS